MFHFLGDVDHGFSVMQPSVARRGCPWNGWYLDPFPLCLAFPDALDGRDSVEYYGSAAPAAALATCPPTPFGERQQVPALLAQQFLRPP
jgi:hypothetical protein